MYLKTQFQPTASGKIMAYPALAFLVGMLAATAAVGCTNENLAPSEATLAPSDSPNETVATQETTPAKGKSQKMETATLGAGCFWCVESVFLQLKGVESVKSGYMGGFVDNPTYKQVCTGQTGHAEVIQIKFDPEVISFAELLEVFWKTHDPTTLNRQGNDVGTQYRSAVFYHSTAQKEEAEKYKKKLNEVQAYPNPIVTEITEASKFYIAEDYHQDYFNNNPNNGYCRLVIPPKLEKLKKVFGDKLKSNQK